MKVARLQAALSAFGDDHKVSVPYDIGVVTRINAAIVVAFTRNQLVDGEEHTETLREAMQTVSKPPHTLQTEY